MFNNHTMTVVTNLGILGNSINNPDLLIVAAITTSDYPDHPNIYNASILVPPTDLLMAWADEVPLVMQNDYPRYLISKDPDDMIVALLATLTKKNVVLYIPNDEFNVFGMVLLNHLYYMYGITCNFMNTTFSINTSKIPYIITKFYLADLMSYEDFMSIYPPNATLPEFVVDKMIHDRPVLQGASRQQYVEYFNKVNASKAYPVNTDMCKIVGDKK